METKIAYADFSSQYAEERGELLPLLDEVMASGKYILGDIVSEFETNFAQLCQVQHALGVANGTDALFLSMKALGIGQDDEVITVPNSWISSASSIALLGATPVFVDVRDDQNMDPALIEKAMTPRTKAIMPVHLTGKCCEMDPILEIADRYGLYIVEDAAQAVGAKYRGKLAGSMGTVGCFSLHPLKNLNGAGDGGMIVTNDSQLAEKLRLMRNHGLQSRNEILFWGVNSRLDSIQAVILNYRLPKLAAVTEKKRKYAALYREKLQEIVDCPEEQTDCYDINHLFVIQTRQRDELQEFLRKKGIRSAIHYPIPIHLQPCARSLGYQQGDFPNVERQSRYILSLPIHGALSEQDIECVADTILEFFSKSGPAPRS